LKIAYDREADALYIQLREAYVDDNIDIQKDIVNITIENLPVVNVETATA